MGDKIPVAAVLRENELLRKIASRAIRLRELGKQSDALDESLREIWEKNPDMPRSGTQQIMVAQAFDTATKAFDEAVMEAATAGMDFTAEYYRAGIQR